MKRAFLLLALLATTTFGAVPAPYPLAVDSQSANAPMLQLYRASPRTIRVQFTDGGTAADLTGLTTNDLHLTWATSNAAPAFVASDVAIYNATNGQADFAFTSGDLNYAQGRYIYEAAAGSTVVKQGVLVILGSPFATGTNSPAWTTNVNLSGYTFSNYPWLTDAPSDGTIYGRQDAGWVAVAGGGGSGTLTNILRGAGSSARLSVSNGAGPQVTLNLDVSGLATGTPVYSLSGYATGTPIYAESDPVYLAGTGALWAAINSKGTGSVGSIAGLATGTPLYVESDPLWAAVSNLFRIGTNVLADQGSTNLLYNGVGLRDGVGAGGGGSETQGLYSVLSISGNAPTVSVQSSYIKIGYDARFYQSADDGGTLSSLIIGGGQDDAEGLTPVANVSSNALQTTIVGGVGNVVGGPPKNPLSGTAHNNSIIGGHGHSITWGDTNTVNKYNSVWGGNNNHAADSSFAAIFGGGGSFLYNCESVGIFSGSHILATGCTSAIFFGGQIAATGLVSALVFAGTNYSDTAPYVPTNRDAVAFGVSKIVQGTNVLFVNGVLQPLMATLDAAQNVLTNVHLRAQSLLIGEGNSLGTGSNNVALVGGSTFGNGSRGNVAAGQALSMGTGQNNFGAGTNHTFGGSYQAVGGGRQNVAGSGNYIFMGGGFGNNLQGTASFGGGGFYNTNSAGDYAVIDGGYQNRAQASYATVAGGATNWALAIGSTIAGGGKMTIAATGDWSFAYNAAPTNAQTFGTKQAAAFYVPGNFYVFNGSYAADNSVGISATNSVLIDAGAGTFTTQVWIFVKGIRVQ